MDGTYTLFVHLTALAGPRASFRDLIYLVCFTLGLMLLGRLMVTIPPWDAFPVHRSKHFSKFETHAHSLESY